MRVHIYGDVMVHARHGTPPSHLSIAQYSTMAFVALSLVFDSIQTRTKRGAIEEVNQTIKIGFEQSWLMYLSPVHA